MKSLLLAIAIFFNPVSAMAENFEGIWEISIVSKEKGQFPWWQQIKYPTKLEISKNHDIFEFQFTDQFDYTCSGKAVSVNNSLEIVFEFCSVLGTKHENSWGAIHHAKIVNGKLHGAVTTNQLLFNWVGKRVK